MAALARQQSSNCSNPVLDLFTQVDGFLIDVEVLEFVIFDKSGANPQQIFPTAGRAVVDTQILCPAGGKISTGHFVAAFTVPVDANLGTHSIQWFFRLTAAAPEQTFEEEFEVLAGPVGAGATGYCSIQDIRDEGIDATVVSDTRLAKLIQLSSRYIDKVTGRFFEPRALTLLLDGRDSHDQLLDIPIIAIDKLEVLEQGVQGVPLTGLIDPGNFRVYNRHLTQGLTQPDDRESPKIAFVREGLISRPLSGLTHFFPRGRQNIRLTGVFGYTDPNGSPTGETPLLISEVCKRLVVRQVPTLAEAEDREDAEKRYRILEEKTRFQSYKLGPLHLQGALTGDPEIDNVLIQYKRPALLGAA